jgi:membrane-bound lytic murein transglycosylase B
MSHKRLTTWQKATALVPLALLSGAWTTSLAVTSSASAAPEQDTTTLPDGTTVPNQALDTPASMSQPGSVAPGIPAGASESMVAAASEKGIPAAALAAYQRAEQVINAADKSCNLTWQLVAAIGRVESDHGRYGGSVLGDDGKSRPGIYGIPLDGSNGTTKIADTDSGQFDDDAIFDRAVGPMQFIPGTWRIVGVDADGDGTRDPQDIDDAALATAVYLCSGDEDLSTRAGQQASVYRYNHSQEYVDLVLSIMSAYLRGDYSPVPNGIAAPTVFVPSTGDGLAVPAKAGQRGGKKQGATSKGPRTASPTGSPAGSGSGSGSAGGTSSDAPAVPQDPPSSDPVESTVDATKKTTDTAKDTADNTVSALDKAKQTCQDNFTAAEIDALGGLTACANAVLDDGLASVESTVAGLLGDSVPSLP